MGFCLSSFRLSFMMEDLQTESALFFHSPSHIVND